MNMGDLSETEWVMVAGIPYHLQSIELIKRIGEFCGELVEVDWQHWSSEFVKILIKRVGPVPDSIPILFTEEEFNVIIVQSPGSSSVSSLSPRGFAGIQMPHPTSATGSVHGKNHTRGCMETPTGSDDSSSVNSNPNSRPT
ncbi:unnamed protein product [Linum trigynum]|uniref:Uncharacterized protein n=1 Tax=Linum trigynum TaxID=586398 RepID=A0AAV2DBA3_9ROSI